MPKPSLCASCKRPLLDEAQIWKGKKYHPQCLEAMKQAARAKDAAKSSALQDPDFLRLRGYICSLWRLPELPFTLQKQIQDYRSRGMSLSEIYLDLYYYFGLLHNDLPESPSLYMVERIHREAQDYWAVIQAARDYNQQQALDPTQQEVTISKSSTSWPSRYRIDEL